MKKWWECSIDEITFLAKCLLHYRIKNAVFRQSLYTRFSKDFIYICLFLDILEVCIHRHIINVSVEYLCMHCASVLSCSLRPYLGWMNQAFKRALLFLFFLLFLFAPTFPYFFIKMPYYPRSIPTFSLIYT